MYIFAFNITINMKFLNVKLFVKKISILIFKTFRNFRITNFFYNFVFADL